MKLATIKPDKYKDLSKTELQEKLVKRDTRDTQDRFMSALSEAKMLRLGSAAGASVLTGLLYEKKPELESLFGSPVSVDHFLAIGGGLAAFLAKDEDVAQASEGIASAGMVPLMRAVGRRIGSSLG